MGEGEVDWLTLEHNSKRAFKRTGDFIVYDPGLIERGRDDEVARQFEGPLRVMLKRKPIDFPFPHIQLLNGSHVHGRGANNPKYLRGKMRVHLVIEDEAAYFKHGKIGRASCRERV